MNLYTILGGLALCALISVSSCSYGHKTGVNDQKVADQQAIDSVRNQIEENKRIANIKLAESLNQVIAVQVERDKIKTQLQQEHQSNVETTNKLHNAYSAYSLRFRADTTGCGASSADSVSSKGDSTGNNDTAICKLSDETTRAISQIVYDADKLRDDYKLLYDWAHE